MNEISLSNLTEMKIVVAEKLLGSCTEDNIKEYNEILAMELDEFLDFLSKNYFGI